MLYQFLLVQLVMELTEVLPRLVAALTVTSIMASQIAWLAAINAQPALGRPLIALHAKDKTEAQLQIATALMGFSTTELPTV